MKEATLSVDDPPHGKQFAIDFWEKLTAAARRDGRLLDPLWGDLAEGESADDEIDEDDTERKASAFHTTKLVLTSSQEEDGKLYDSFRADFSIFPIKNIPHSTYLEGEIWDSLLQEHVHTIQFPEAQTLLRTDALGMFSTTETGMSEGIVEVSKIKFLFIEVTRIKDEIYDRSFRRKLELFDMKVQSDLLESSLSDPSKEAVALRALKLLRTQWPNPSISVLKNTGVVKVLRRGAKSGSLESIRTECQRIFSSWKDLRDLGRIREAWHFGTDDVQRLRPILEKAGEALVKDLTTDSTLSAQISYENRKENGRREKNFPSVEDLTFVDISVPKSVAYAFDRHGVVILPGYITSVKEHLKQATALFEALVVEQLEPRGVSSDGTDKFVLIEAQQQPGYRIDNRYGLDDPESPIAKLGQRLNQEVPSLLFPDQENDFYLAKFGVLHARPRKTGTSGDSQSQIWRRDGAPLFSGEQHPAHCFNIFIPLVDISTENGTIEFVPGTHMTNKYEENLNDVTTLAQQNPSAKHELAARLQLKAGAAIACDVRILLRGLVNCSLEDQPMLYFRFARNWFREPEMAIQSRHTKSLQDLAIHTKLIVLTRLRQMVTGASSLRVLSLDETYGHPHYTKRFDLLLLDCLLSDETRLQSTALVNMAAVIHFCTLSEGDKETTAREFLYAFSQRNQYRKIRVLQNNSQKWYEQGETTDDSSPDEISTLYDLAASILMEESTLLAKLGFSSDEQGVCCLLAMLKAHAARHALGCIGITENDLDEAFTSWWHTAQGRFTFLPGYAESAEEQAKRKVLVIFSGLGAGRLVRPEWGESLQNVISDPRLDVLHVIDPSFSFYCQDPKCLWKGCDYYTSELDWRLCNYQDVMFLGASAGGTAALRFSPMAERVLVVSPIVDILSFTAIPRCDFPDAVKEAFQQSLSEILREGRTSITVYYRGCYNADVSQVEVLPKRENIKLTLWFEENRNKHAEYLEDNGALVELVEAEVRSFLGGSVTRRRSVLVGSF